MIHGKVNDDDDQKHLSVYDLQVDIQAYEDTQRYLS